MTYDESGVWNAEYAEPTTDIVERIRADKCEAGCDYPHSLCLCSSVRSDEAADEIVRLRALITEWAEANDAGTRDARGEWDTEKACRIGAATAALREEANR